MKHIVWLLKWVLKAAIFFTLFAFALNNQQNVTMNFFFGTQWQTPMVLVVLAAFSIGLIAGVLAMLPRWWKQRKAANHAHGFSSIQGPSSLNTKLPHGL